MAFLAGLSSLARAQQPLLTTATLSSITDSHGVPLLPRRTKPVRVEAQPAALVVELSREAVERPWRPADVTLLREGLRRAAGVPETSQVVVRVAARPLDDYVPPFWRETRVPRCGPSTATARAAAPLRQVARPAGAPAITNGLAGRHIVVWASHGLYYDKESGRWTWQRPRMFTTVEDRLTMSVVNDYLIPALERAGATVISCRERDYQTHEVIVDDGDSGATASGLFECSGFDPSRQPGFASGKAPYAEGVNPHALGATHEWPGSGSALARWTPNIPEAGDYAVYVSYAADAQRSPRAHYRVHYWGGMQDVFINQRMAGNMWVYLGTFRFARGAAREAGCVELLGDSQSGGSLSADAVKFGGGMSDVKREGAPSGYPRYLEAARYWFQYMGVDAKLVYAFGRHAGEDYTEDYVGRPEFVNYLVGTPCGPNQDRKAPGKGVPIDLALALHTDASLSTGIVGTLAIYKLVDETKSDRFPDGRDRMLNRDLADLVQTQIVEDVRAQFCSTWNRRELGDRDYAEARRPNVPCVLIEALSHQNYDDVKFALDPRFRSTWGRAIYKGMLRFLATEGGYDAVVEPLPPRLMAARLDGGQVRLEWQATADPLEPSAMPTGYIVYRRVGDSGFGAGTYVGNTTAVTLPLATTDASAVESFAVAAVNAGGESAPSEACAVCAGRDRRVLVVNGFDRLSGPAMMAGVGPSPDSLGGTSCEGAVRSRDRGVADVWNSPLTGDQFDFDRAHAWEGEDSPFTNDHPGHGASLGDLETSRELGRTHDLVTRHAAAFAAAGYGVDTVSAQDCVRLPAAATAQHYAVIDVLMGEQRTTLPPPAHDPRGAPADRMAAQFEVWPAPLQDWMRGLSQQRTTVLVSGAYVLTDPVIGAHATTGTRTFAKEVLRAKWTSERASTTNEVVSLGSPLRVRFSRDLGQDGVYGVESPGGMAAAHKSGKVVLRYADTGVGAAVADQVGMARMIVVGFPLECVIGAEARAQLVNELLK
jgi:N-acetylmuramoyl-L-alanine amidase